MTEGKWLLDHNLGEEKGTHASPHHRYLKPHPTPPDPYTTPASFEIQLLRLPKLITSDNKILLALVIVSSTGSLMKLFISPASPASGQQQQQQQQHVVVIEMP